MPLKRFVVSITALFLLGLGLTTAAHAQDNEFSLIGGGGQLHIGNGLALPIQQAAINSITTTTMFPPLLVPVVAGPAPVLTGTTSKPLQVAGGKSGYQRRLNVPPGVLVRTPVKSTVGVKFSNPTIFAVATNLGYSWPSASATFSTGMAPPASIMGFGGTMLYSNALGARFGGPASFAISSGDPIAGDLFPAAPVTVWIKINGTTPACTFMLTGMGPACINGVILALPTGLAGPGGAVSPTVMTPGLVIPGLNVAAVKMGLTPLGTHVPGLVTLHATSLSMTAMVPAPFLVAMAALPTNMAMSQPGPWTTGQVIIANPAAMPATETWTLSGRDDRTALGGGAIQMVSGALSTRPASFANANRGWVRLELSRIGAKVPSMSPMGFAAAAALILLGFGYATRQRLFA